MSDLSLSESIEQDEGELKNILLEADLDTLEELEIIPPVNIDEDQSESDGKKLEITMPEDDNDGWIAVRKVGEHGEYTELVKTLPDRTELYKPATGTMCDNDPFCVDNLGNHKKGHGHRGPDFDRKPVPDPVKAPGV